MKATNAERALLGCLLLGEWDNELTADLFHSASHVRIFGHIKALHEEGIAPDVVTISSRLLAFGEEEQTRVGGLDYVQNLPEMVPTSRGWDRYVRVCADAATRRRIRVAADELAAASANPDEDLVSVLDRAEQALSQLTPQTNVAAVDAKEGAERAWGLLESRMEARQRGQTICACTTGISDLDERLLPALQAGCLTVVAARPGMGKSVMAAQWAIKTSQRRQGVAFFSLEMGVEQLTHRGWASLATVDLDRFLSGDPNVSQLQDIEDAHSIWHDLPLFICDRGGITLSEIRSIVRRLRVQMERAGTPLGLIVVDYLQLMGAPRHMKSREEAVAHNSKGLKALAKECGVPVLMLSQLNRGVESRPNKRPLLSDLRESGAIEQDADAVMFLYRHGYYFQDTDDPEHTECIVAKLRDGQCGTVHTQFQGRYSRFLKLERRYA